MYAKVMQMVGDGVLRAGIYTRLSLNRGRDEQGVITTSQQVVRQEAACRALAESRGWAVVDVYEDDDVSAFGRQKRPQYERMLADIRAGALDAIVALHTDRLYRRPLDLEALVEIAEARGLAIATVVSGEIDLATASGRMLARMLGAAARAEVERLSERTLAGKRDAASKGAWQGGQRPYGYRTFLAPLRAPDGSALEVVPEEAEVVREAARRVLEGDSLRAVAQSLNARGLTTANGCEWTGSALRKVLLRPTTAGRRARGTEDIGPGQWPALLPVDEWRGVCATLSDPSRRTNRGWARRYLGSGLYLCGVCGGPLGGNTTAGGGPGARRAAYRCRATDRDGGVHVVRDAEYLDAYVEAVLVERLSRPDAAVTHRPRASVDVAPLHAEAEALRGRLNDMARGWASGVLTQAQLTTGTAEANRLLEEVEQRIARAAQRSALSGMAGDALLGDRWQTLGLDRRRAVLKALAEVTVLPRVKRGRPPATAPKLDPELVRIRWRDPDDDAQQDR